MVWLENEKDKHKPGTTEPMDNPLVPTNPVSGIGEWLSKATFQNLRNMTAGHLRLRAFVRQQKKLQRPIKPWAP